MEESNISLSSLDHLPSTTTHKPHSEAQLLLSEATCSLPYFIQSLLSVTSSERPPSCLHLISSPVSFPLSCLIFS